MHPRHTKLLDLICQNGRMAVTELSAALGVSEVTIRKDLNMLAHQGLLKREHGYACMVSSDDIATISPSTTRTSAASPSAPPAASSPVRPS